MRIIAGQWRSRRLQPIRGRGVRPTTDRVREAWFSALGSDVIGARVLDLFAGSGALGLEALSRGADSVVFVDRAESSLRTLRANVDALDAGPMTEVVRADAFTYLERLKHSDGLAFDIALADPPYERGHAARLVERFADAPFASQVWVEHRTGETIPEVEGLAQRRYGDTTLSILAHRS